MVSVSWSGRMGVLYGHPELVAIMVSLFIPAVNCLEAYIVEAVVYQEPISCWTCPNQTDNAECNSWAPETQCLKNHTLCQTVHTLKKATGESVSLIKRCALVSDCSVETIGCHDTPVPGIQECVSCCNYPFCNKHTPSNFSRALYYSSLTNTAMYTTSSAILATFLIVSIGISIHITLVYR